MIIPNSSNELLKLIQFSIGYFWSLVLCTCQLIPFLYFSYLFYAFLIIAIPMTGRNGTETNPDVVIAFLCALGTIMALAFLVSAEIWIWIWMGTSCDLNTLYFF